MLADGGNAFDAALAGLFVACMAEPVLCSLGGGGFLLAQPGHGDSVLYDFFCQTPGRRLPAAELDFLPAPVNFGAATQEFQIGMGAVAVPGMVAGIFAIHGDLCTLPLSRLMAPAIALARKGAAMAPLQSFILEAVAPIFQWSAERRAIFNSRAEPGKTLRTGERLALPELADLFEALAREGEDLFYRGEVAEMIAAANEQGGAVDLDDMAAYKVHRRRPLARRFGDVKVLGNLPPSSGGPLLAFTLGLLEDRAKAPPPMPPGHDHFVRIARAMQLTSQARRASGLTEQPTAGSDDMRVKALLSEDFMADYRAQMPGRAAKIGGTTHISAVDAKGNAAALSVSNGEGCGHILPRFGFMLNNMLGEEDLNPNGFFQWRPNSRLTSMMSPTLARWPDGRLLALGSGGANRIRSAVLQVPVNHLRLDMPLAEAVAAPRIHLERDVLHIEDGHDDALAEHLGKVFPEHQIWPDRNFFFGGVHGAAFDPRNNTFTAAGDPRRGGSAA